MAHKVICGKEKHAEVAEQFLVKDSVVHNLLKKVHMDTSHLMKAFEDERAKAQAKQTTVEVAR